MEKTVATREEAIKTGFLEDRIVYLRPSPRQGKMIKTPAHVGYFMYEGASVNFVLPKDERGELVNVFRSKEEQAYFEKELGVDLSPYKKKGNFWNTFKVKFIKSPITMYLGSKFDLTNPTDNLRVRVLEACREVAPTWEERFDFPSYKFALVSEDYEENKASNEALKMQEIWKYFGSISNNASKMKDFVAVYLATNKKTKTVNSDFTKEQLMATLNTIINDDPNGYMDIVEDEHFETKAFIMKAVSVGAIEKLGVNKYVLPGETASWQLNELVIYMNELKDESDDIYLKIRAQIEMKSRK